MSTLENYTVIGAGHGGKAMTAHLALMGLHVTLYNRTFDHVAALKARVGSIWKAQRADRTDSPGWPWLPQI